MAVVRIRVGMVYRMFRWKILMMPSTTIWMPTQKVKKAIILLMIMLPELPSLSTIFLPWDRNR